MVHTKDNTPLWDGRPREVEVVQDYCPDGSRLASPEDCQIKLRDMCEICQEHLDFRSTNRHNIVYCAGYRKPPKQTEGCGEPFHVECIKMAILYRSGTKYLIFKCPWCCENWQGAYPPPCKNDTGPGNKVISERPAGEHPASERWMRDNMPIYAGISDDVLSGERPANERWITWQHIPYTEGIFPVNEGSPQGRRAPRERFTNMQRF